MGSVRVRGTVAFPSEAEEHLWGYPLPAHFSINLRKILIAGELLDFDPIFARKILETQDLKSKS